MGHLIKCLLYYSTGLRPIGNQSVDELIPVLSDVSIQIFGSRISYGLNITSFSIPLNR